MATLSGCKTAVCVGNTLDGASQFISSPLCSLYMLNRFQLAQSMLLKLLPASQISIKGLKDSFKAITDYSDYSKKLEIHYAILFLVIRLL